MLNQTKSTRKVRISRKKTLKISKLYEGLSGFGLANSNENSNVTYGELKAESIPILYEIYSRYAPLSNILGSYRNFYDLGCGVGKIVLGLTALNSSLKGVGIELVSERVQQANTALQRLRDTSIKQRVEFVCLSFLDDSINYSNACWVFISNLCFTDDTKQQLVEKLERELNTGSIVVCSKALNSTKFEQLNYITLPMSWSDESKVYVYKKI
jgi:SAM-dependent methyltransferase